MNEQNSATLNSMSPMNDNDFALACIIPHCQVILVLDTSHSMWGKGLHNMMQSLHTFFATLKQEEFVNSELEVAAVSMGENLGMLEEFCPFRDSRLPMLEIRPKGDTPIGAALSLALEKLDERQAKALEQGFAQVTPHLVLLSDGKRSSDDYRPIAEEIRQRVKAGKLICHAIAMGDSPDCGVLSEIAGDKVVHPQYGDLRTAFTQVGKVVSETYTDEVIDVISQPVDNVPAEDKAASREAGAFTDDKEAVEYLLDGSNLMYLEQDSFSNSKKQVSLKHIMAIVSQFDREGVPYQVFFDASAPWVIKRDAPNEEGDFKRLFHEHPSQFHLVPAGTCADLMLLQLAEEKPSRRIISNDQFRDHANQYPWVHEKDRVFHAMPLGRDLYIVGLPLKFTLDESQSEDGIC